VVNNRFNSNYTKKFLIRKEGGPKLPGVPHLSYPRTRKGTGTLTTRGLEMFRNYVNIKQITEPINTFSHSFSQANKFHIFLPHSL